MLRILGTKGEELITIIIYYKHREVAEDEMMIQQMPFFLPVCTFVRLRRGSTSFLLVPGTRYHILVPGTRGVPGN